MNTLLIGYDLNKQGQDYQNLINAIELISDTRWHHLDSTWIIKTHKSPVEIRDLLKQHIDRNDELLVVTLAKPAAWTGFSLLASKWLVGHL